MFPRIILEKENIEIINFHNALLPQYPGRNAASWAIYNGEKETGITWHYVNNKIDAGNIIVQKRILIGSEEKAYELAARLMNIAIEVFEECYVDILRENISDCEQLVESTRKIYKSSDIPGNGFFSMDDEGEHIYKLLRSIDFGKNRIFPNAITKYQGCNVEILQYKKVGFVPESGDDGYIYIYEGWCVKNEIPCIK